MDKDGNKVKVDSDWEICASMKHARANFAAINLGNRVYVFGGISGNDPQIQHQPVLVEDVIERYVSQTNTWEVFDIPNAPRCAAFSWTPTTYDEGSIIILGGTDGNLMSQDLCLINFKDATCKHLPAEH